MPAPARRLVELRLPESDSAAAILVHFMTLKTFGSTAKISMMPVSVMRHLMQQQFLSVHQSMCTNLIGSNLTQESMIFTMQTTETYATECVLTQLLSVVYRLRRLALVLILLLALAAAYCSLSWQTCTQRIYR